MAVRAARALVLAVWLSLLGTGALTRPLAGQLTDTVSATTEPLFTKRDGWIAGAFVAGALVLAPLDLSIADAARDPVLQENDLLNRSADFFRVLGFPGAVLLSSGAFAAGRAADQPRLADVGLHTTEAILLASAFTRTAKALTGRARPRLEADEPYSFQFARGFGNRDYRSFPSGHATMAFATAAALTTELAYDSPEHKLVVGSVLFSGATAVAISRLFHDEHWASDVVIGAAVGSFSGWKVVRYAHAHPDNRLDRVLLGMRMFPSVDGGMVVVWSAPL